MEEMNAFTNVWSYRNVKFSLESFTEGIKPLEAEKHEFEHGVEPMLLEFFVFFLDKQDSDAKMKINLFAIKSSARGLIIST